MLSWCVSVQRLHAGVGTSLNSCVWSMESRATIDPLGHTGGVVHPGYGGKSAGVRAVVVARECSLNGVRADDLPGLICSPIRYPLGTAVSLGGVVLTVCSVSCNVHVTH